jgi:quercetin dioxygenase-like cupin family protein
MSEQQIITQLEEEAYHPVYAYTAEPNEIDEEHSHKFETKLVILEGDINITSEVEGVIMNMNYKAGQDILIPRGKIHSAKVGAGGCRYVVGEKH